MNMAKASKADMDMAIELCNALDALGNRLIPCMPEAVEQLRDGDEMERFDSDDDEQCGRALRHLLEIADRGSLMRVIWGMGVLLDPANRVVDPDADTLQHHPATVAALSAMKASGTTSA
jgi:hypothetical protein